MNDFDTKFIALKEIKVTHNPENPCSLRLEENVLVAGKETCTLKNQRQTKREKSRRKYSNHVETQDFSTFLGDCLLEGRVSNKFDESASTLDIYEQVINLDVLTEMLVQQSNVYSRQNWRKFLTNAQEIKVVIGFNYIMTLSQLPSKPLFWDYNHFVDNVGIQNIFAITRYQVVLQNNHFAGNTK